MLADKPINRQNFPTEHRDHIHSWRPTLWSWSIHSHVLWAHMTRLLTLALILNIFVVISTLAPNSPSPSTTPSSPPSIPTENNLGERIQQWIQTNFVVVAGLLALLAIGVMVESSSRRIIVSLCRAELRTWSTL